MAETYLHTAYKDRERVKSLGARWDAARKQWYVPDGRDLAAFTSWLSADQQSALSAVDAPGSAASTQLTVPAKGISLSELLGGVAQAVTQAYRVGQWVRVEVVKVDVRRGHIYLELAERSAKGDALAQARAMIWADTANEIVPAFERATGVVLGAGIKLLLRAKPTFSSQYGLSLSVDAIDPDYTLGDLEAKRREIRARLQREGLTELNRSLPTPWDFTMILVVAPQGAAGLGDFQAEADRLQRFGLCHFVIVHSRFQGEGSAAELRQAILDGLANCQTTTSQPDAIVIIRGGGAVNDLAWLNDYDLARCICEMPVPVLTGIGHERDQTVLDEVAHSSYDTPSKVIAGIEQLIVKRAQDARAHLDAVMRAAEQALHRTRRVVEQAHADIRANALLALRDGREQTAQQFQTIRHDSLLKLEQARHAVPATMADIAARARQTLREARLGAEQQHDAVIERSAQHVDLARDRATQALIHMAEAARRHIADARTGSEATMREIAGQGPDKTLSRGFAVVRDETGATLTGIAAAREAKALQIEFRDGRLPARIKTENATESETDNT